MKKTIGYKIKRFRTGYVVEKDGSIISKIYSTKEKIQQDIENCKLKTRPTMDTEVRSLVNFRDSNNKILHADIYLKSKSCEGRLHELLQETDIVIEVYYNIQTDNIEKIYVHDGFLGHIEYQLSLQETRLIQDRIIQYLNARGIL